MGCGRLKQQMKKNKQQFLGARLEEPVLTSVITSAKPSKCRAGTLRLKMKYEMVMKVPKV